MSRLSDNINYIASKATPVFNIPVVREDLPDEPKPVDCTLPENKDKDECLIAGEVLILFIISILIAVLAYGLIIFAAMNTNNQNLKIFLIASLFLPFLTPITFVLAILILTNII